MGGWVPVGAACLTRVALILTYEIRRRLDRVIEAGYMVKRGEGYDSCLLTDKGMAVLLAEADNLIQLDDLVKPSLAWERLWSCSGNARRLPDGE